MKKIFLSITILFFTQLALAGADSVVTSTAGAAAQSQATSTVAKQAIGSSEATKSLSEKLGNFMESPTGVMIVSGIGGLNSYTLMQAASDQVDESEANIKKIDTLMQTFTDAWASHCPNGRDNLNEPACYCYLASGAKNSNRSNSQTCQSLWATNDAKVTAIASDYKGTSTANDPTGCLTTSGQFDEGCKCKKFIDSSGNNACKKTGNLVALADGNSFMTTYLNNSGASKLTEAVNALTQGNIGLSKLNTNSMAMANAFQKDLNKKLLDQFNSDPNNKGFKGFKNTNEILNAQNKYFPKKDLDAISAKNGGSQLASLSFSPNAEMAKAIKDVQKKTGLELTGTGKGTGKKEENKNMNFNFGDNPVNGNGASNNIEFADKNYKYKNNDISKENGASLFEIISNRYLESGFNRLFNEDKK